MLAVSCFGKASCFWCASVSSRYLGRKELLHPVSFPRGGRASQGHGKGDGGCSPALPLAFPVTLAGSLVTSKCFCTRLASSAPCTCSDSPVNILCTLRAPGAATLSRSVELLQALFNSRLRGTRSPSGVWALRLAASWCFPPAGQRLSPCPLSAEAPLAFGAASHLKAAGFAAHSSELL